MLRYIIEIRGHRGFTLIGILISLVIVCLLFLYSFNSFKGTYTGYSSTRISNMEYGLAKMRMQQIKTAEQIYFSLHRRYGTFEQLVSDGQIASGYTTRTAGHGTPYVPLHNFVIELTGDGFIVTATPDTFAGAPEDAPILRITNDSDLEEIPR